MLTDLEPQITELAAPSGEPREPIAIIGIGCRFPGGADDPTKFWKLLAEGADAIVDIPPDRWNSDRFCHPDPAKPGKMYMRKGGFLRERVDHFDPRFFGIAPREALQMDPQQRLLLEVAWEGMQDAGLQPKRLVGSDTGVYIGAFTLDSMLLQLSPLNRESINNHYGATGATMTMLSNRISYVFDFRGPSINVDTACSSSLVALHYACQGIWNGECSLALAGGVNIMLVPEFPMVMCKGHFLAPDGHCKSFDERADGYARGEGCGIVVLKPLSAALRDADDIYAVVRGTGVNQDGRTDGITVPSAEAQEALIREVYKKASVPLNQVGYVEAHGTGTPVGDPIEASVLGKTVGAGRADAHADPCLVGSVKANIGHLEAAAGVAGVIKAALCLRHQQVPPLAGLQNANPKIPFQEFGLRLPRALEPMPAGADSTYVGVNSFGYGGTNAHAVLEQAPRPKFARDGVSNASVKSQAPDEQVKRCYVLPISARSKEALPSLTQSYLDLLSHAGTQSLQDICYSAGVRRDHLEHRLAVAGETATDVLKQLQSYQNGDRAENVAAGKLAVHTEPELVFVFSGMGPQWWAMGHELLRTEPVFRQKAEECDALFKEVAGWSILAAMTVPESESRMYQTEIAQPANFVIQVSLAELWRSWGVQPAAVVGHSVGEVSAAYAAGALNLRDAISVIYHRSRVQQTTSGMGKMLAVGLTPAAAQTLLKNRSEGICIAAINSPTAVTLSGDPGPLQELASELEQRNIYNTFLRVTVAYHSHQMEPLKDDLETSLAGIQPQDPTIPLYSTVTGGPVKGRFSDGPYWFKNIRQPVLFSDAMDRLVDDGYTLFLEIGPHPVLSASVNECLVRHGVTGNALTSLRRKEPEGLNLSRAVGQLYVAGYSLSWQKLFPSDSSYIKLPPYPWQRERYWSESERNANDRTAPIVHPLLGVPAWAAAKVWECDLNSQLLTYLSDHIIDGVPLLPGAAYVEGALAIHALTADGPPVVEDLRISDALQLPKTTDVRMQWVYDEKTGAYRAYSRELADGSKWTLHASARIYTGAPRESKTVDLKQIQERCSTRVLAESLYPLMRAHGAHYAASFQPIREVFVGTREVLAELELPKNLSASGYHLHPSLLDGAFQSLIVGLLDFQGDTVASIYVPVRINRVRFYPETGVPVWCYGKLIKISDRSVEGNILLCNRDGAVVAEVDGLRFAALQSGKVDAVRQLQPLTYELNWEVAAPAEAKGGPARWLLFGDSLDVGSTLTAALYAKGAAEVVQLHPQKDRTDLEEALRQFGMANCRGVVYLAGLDITRDPADPVGTAGGARALEFIQALAAVSDSSSARLYVLTRGAQQVGIEEPVSGLAQAALTGLARVAASEFPSLRSTLVDIDPVGSLRSSDYLALELLADSAEDEVALREDQRYVHRMVRASTRELEATAASRRLSPAANDKAFTLEIGKLGSLDSLRFREIERQKPAPGEVELKIQMASLNFKDVLKVLGVLPEQVYEDTFSGLTLGMEAAGVVTDVGEGVTEYKIGDEVVAALRSCFSSHVHTPLNMLQRRPASTSLSVAEWAASPVVFVTAYYSLVELARLSPGEKVLIHAAAGGVGLAAIQVAQWVGAEIFVTAGSQEKREYLRSLGVKDIFDSRSLSFADDIIAATHGYGVDVVLNSISGEALMKSVSLLAPFGRFVEIGKRDIIENNQLPMLPFNRNLSFSACDLDRMIVDKPALYTRMVDAVWTRLRAGDFRGLPVRVFSAGEISDAFRFMAQSKQIGKIVIDMEELAGVSLLPLAETEKPIRAQGTYLITGGFGGIGLELSKWVAKQGCQHLVLVGRRGPASALAKQTLEDLQNAGVSVMAVAADISQEAEVAKLMATIADCMPPLKGIFHSAAVLDDGFLADLNASRFEKVMAPKALGAWHLHQHTRSMALDAFVLFSSVSAWVGNPGQGNYVAANAFLDALAQHRRAEGLPAISVSWGAVADVGMVAENEVAAATLARAGIRPLPIASVLGALPSLLRWSPVNLGVMDVDWARWSQFQPRTKSCPRYSHLLAELETVGEGLDSRSIQVALEALPPEKRLERMAAALAEIVAEALNVSADKLDFHQSFSDMGVDSLLGVELLTSISMKLGIDVSLMELIKSKGIAGLAGDLLAKMKISAGDVSGSSDHPESVVEQGGNPVARRSASAGG